MAEFPIVDLTQELGKLDEDKFLTYEENYALKLTSNLSRSFGKIVGSRETRLDDLREVVNHIHALQNMILAQAAARLYPDEYRLMGEILD